MTGSPAAQAPAMALAVDLGGTKAESAIIRKDGSVLPGSRARVETGREATRDTLRAGLSQLVHTTLKALPPGALLVGAGIGSAGPLHRSTRTVSPVNLPHAADLPIAEIIETAVRIDHDHPVSATLALDGTALALAEHWLTPGRPPQSLLGIVVSTGVGGGLVIDGRAVTGSTGNAGQIGQSYVSGYGATCTLEEIASGPATVRYARAQGWNGETGEDLASAAAEGDSVALAAINRSARAVGDTVASLAAVVDFERVVIAGGFSRVAPDYIDQVADRLRYHPFDHVRSITAVAATQPVDSPLIGAAALAFTAVASSASRRSVMLD